MRKSQKKALYESIMRNVSKTVREALTVPEPAWTTSSTSNFGSRPRSARPKTWDELVGLIEDAIETDGPEANLNFIDTSLITDMHELFAQFPEFNGDLSRWDVSNVVNMNSMFNGCRKFNGDLSLWDVSNVTDMRWMFAGCWEFNSDLSRWDVSNVVNTGHMFYACKKFNADLSHWDLERDEYVRDMFRLCPITGNHLPLYPDLEDDWDGDDWDGDDDY